MALFSVLFLIGGLLAASFGATLGFDQFTQTEQSVLMLILPCCGLPLIVLGSSATLLFSQAKAPNDQTFVRMNILGLVVTVLLIFGMTILISSFAS
ncbi:MAG: hypothetical protein HUU38_07690 [Anaerolineales bacterium]|nr:hypothetical protein [Anaerolineales bacterium]